MSLDPLLAIEAAAVMVALATALTSPQTGSGWFCRLERTLDRIGRRRVLSVGVVAMLPLLVRLALWPVMKIPQPSVHDEFGYLLTAQTFASGKLAEPPSPFWKHFESPNIIQQPTYASVYPVAQSLFLAAAERLGAHPWFGVWISVGLMCGAICWMLQAWVPPGWAFLGGLLAALRLGVFSYWMNSYWGGAPAALGGALVFGALPRVFERKRARDGLLLALGILILANSRPYEGLFLTVPAGAALIFWLWKNGFPLPLMRRIAPPVACVLALGAGAMAYYNWRVTGSPSRLPYQVSRAAYGFPIIFLWEKPRPAPVYHSEQMRDFYTWLENLHRRESSPAGLATMMLGKVRTLWFFYCGPLFTLPLLMLPWTLRDRGMRLILLAGAIGLLGLASEAWMSAHYAAPLTAIVLAVIVEGLRRLRSLTWRERPAGLFLARSIPMVCVLMLAARAAAGLVGLPLSGWPVSWCSVNRSNVDRAAVEARLRSAGGPSLVFVRYAARHDVFNEYVFNEADMNRAEVVWARELDPESNRALMRYFRGRRVWLLEPDLDPVRLTPYPGTENPQPRVAKDTSSRSWEIVRGRPPATSVTR